MLGEKSFDELKSLKRELKAWESMFERKHCRKPNKDDVNDAPEEIRETYTRYKNLRTGVEKKKEVPKQDKEDKPDEVFGKSLNKSKDLAGSANRSVRIQMSPSDLKPIKLCHGQRHKKSLLENLNKLSADDDSKKRETCNMSNPVTSGVNDSALSGDDLGVKDVIGFSITSKKHESLSKPGMMLGKSKVTQRMKRRSAIASDWLEKHKSDVAETSLSEHDMKSDPFESPSKTQDATPLKDRARGSSLPDCSSINYENNESGFSVANAEKFTPNVDTANMNVKESETSSPLKSASLVSQNVNCSGKNSFKKATNGVKNSTTAEEDELIDGRTGGHQHSTVPSVGNLTSASMFGGKEMQREVISSDLDSLSVDPQEKFLDVSATTLKRKRSVSYVDENGATDKVGKPFEDGSGEKPSKIMRTSSNEIETETSKEEPTKAETTKKGKQKRSSGLVSENFRALNMKVRRFSRGSRGTNYGAYKRKMWKQKQQAKEQGPEKKPVAARSWKKKTTTTRSRNHTSGSTTTCFKCGEDGHWVKDCPRNRSNATTPKTETWSEPVKLPSDLEVGAAEWEATESKLQLMLTERLPRPHNTLCNIPPAIEPLYQPENGKPIGTPEEVFDTLRKLGFDSFRSGQEEAIMQIMCGLSTLVVLSTGAGKSLCYQLPAYMYSKRSPCLTLVISPLVSLMEDQVVGLPFGLCGVSLNTNMTKPQREKAVEQICSGSAAVVLVSPEALVGGKIGPGCLPHVSKLPPIAFACIDEAHCLSEWSYNFRPSYLRVCKVLRERFGVTCFLGLTATATRSTAISVAEHLGINHRPEAIIRGATIPPNLNLSVSRDLNRDRAILELLQGKRFSDCDSIIIYCTRREQTDRLATYLRTCLQKNPMNTSSCITEQTEEAEEAITTKGKKRGRKRKSGAATKKATKKSASWQAECYHAGMSAAQRRSVQKKFMSGELRIVVATVAFGMGLDKANVRAILHYNLPKSFESYVQEIGRAGRDGLPSHCHVFIDPEGKDVRELRRHAYSSTVDRRSIKKMVAQIFPKCDCKTLEANMKARRERELAAVRSRDAGGSLGTGSDVLRTEETGDKKSETFDWADNDDDDDDDQLLDDVVKFETCVQNREGLETDGGMDVDADAGDASTSLATVECIAEINGEHNTSISDPISKEPDDGLATNSATEDQRISDPISKEPEDGLATNSTTEDQSACAESKCVRVCGGHEVALPIEKAVQEMDMKEEGIATLLCYLELHDNKWLQILQPVRSTCTLKFYGGPAHLHFVAQKVPLVTAAVAYARRRGELERSTSSLTFPIVEIVDNMGWDLEPARRELYALQWNDSLKLAAESGLSDGHSGILVEFTDLAFHLRAPGDLADNERDEICDFLEDRIRAQERSQVAQLHGVWSTFNEQAHPNCWQNAEECDEKVDEQLKSVVKAYFESENDPTKVELETLAEARKKFKLVESNLPAISEEPVNWDCVARDIRSFLNLHADCELSGRAVARIFHGIDSPCFPASVWGRDRRFWRRHLDVDFNLLRKFAIKELIKYR